ncbi:MAG: adenosylcobinamide amidohydrolase [Methanosphaera sp.]|nr:adenosylcobinamide amidohydrolase [Methanosphaera sp.]
MSNYSKTLYDDEKFNISIIDNAIVLKLGVNNNLLISSWHNGGYQENMLNVVNQSLTEEDYSVIEKLTSKNFQIKRFKELGLDPDKSTGLITSANMDSCSIITKSYKKLNVTTVVTAGADKNAVKAGDKASFYEYDNTYQPIAGTINIITFIDANLEEGALATALITITEAKTSVLEDLKVQSNFSTHIATGTGTDGVCVISNTSSENHLENAGKHSKLGELIAKSVREAVFEALYLQTGMCPDYQRTVLSRLSRFNISFDDFYENADDTSLDEYAGAFYQFNGDEYYISWISCLLNLVDEYQVGMLTLKDISKSIVVLTNTFLSLDKKVVEFKSINQINDFIIDSVNEYLQVNK